MVCPGPGGCTCLGGDGNTEIHRYTKSYNFTYMYSIRYSAVGGGRLSDRGLGTVDNCKHRFGLFEETYRL